MVTWLVILVIASTAAYVWSIDNVDDEFSEPVPVPDPPEARGRHRQAVPGKTGPLRDLSPWRIRRA